MKLLRLTFCLLLLNLGLLPRLQAQMVVGSDTLYGNEWINYQQNYFKIKVGGDAMYRLDFAALSAAGVFGTTTTPQGQNFQLWKNGKSMPLFVSTAGALGTTDFMAFYGEGNRGEIDRFLYDNPTFQVNPEYSLLTDTAIYYLTWDMNTTNPDLITTTVNDLTNLPPKENYCWAERVVHWSQQLKLGIDRGGSGHVSAKYDLGEGYTKSTFTTNQSNNITLSNRYNAGPDATFEVQLLSEAGNHNIEIKVNNNTYLLDTFANWAVKNYVFNVPMGGTGSNTMPVLVLGNASADDKFRLAYIKARYPRMFDFSNATIGVFDMEASPQRQYYEITGFNTGGVAPILYDLTNRLYIETQLTGSTIKVSVPLSAVARRFVLINPNTYTSPSIEAVNLQPFDPTQGGDYIMLTHSKLFHNGSGVNYIQDYADYRASVAGGGYTPVIVDIQQVYEQFGYGIQRHEQAIRNFVQWAVKHWQSDYLFIIGKGVFYGQYRNGNVDFAQFELVPSFGYPSSDNLLATLPNKNEPEIAVGRIAAYTPDMVRIYLDKVKETELAYQTAPQTIEGRGWMKNFLHLGGGDSNIQDFIKGRLTDMEDTIRQSRLQASVLGYYKNSTNAVQNANSEDVINRINEGLGWITFFGHSAPNTLDFDIGDPNQYANEGRYPMIYAMGCNTNRLLEVSSTLSEAYVFVEDRGAIGFIGSTATTSLSNLNEYGKVLYQKLGNELYGETIGNILKSTVEDYPLGGFWGALVKHNIFLHGDPAVRIYPQAGVDYVLNKRTSKVIPNLVNVRADSFEVELVVANIGSADRDSFNILIEQQYPNGEKETLKTLRVRSTLYETIYRVVLPLRNQSAVGRNELHITLDSDGEVDEMPSMAENNNFEVLPFSIISNNASPIFPYAYSIVSEQNLTLKASTSNILSSPIQYFIELDTTALFNSPLKQTVQKESTGGLITWQPNITLQDSVVYYWRVSLDSTLTNGVGFDWQPSSFIYIPQSVEGWNQSHFFQKQKNDYTLITQLETNRRLDFGERTKELRIQNGAFPTLFWTEASLSLDGFAEFTFWPCPNNKEETFQVAVFEKNTLDYVMNPYNNGVSPNCWQAPLRWYIFDVFDTNERQKLLDTLANVPSNYYVAIFVTKRVVGSMFANQWAADSINFGTNIFQVLEAQGATQIRSMETNETPYILMYKKDAPTWAGFREVKAVSNTDIIQATTLLTGKQSSGSITSEPIGPAKAWGDLMWQASEVTANDTVSLDVIGVTQSGTDTLLMSSITASNLSLDFVNATVYPYLKLRYNAKDETDLTASQLDYWRVLFTPLPDATLNPDGHLVFYKDTIQQGDDFRFEIAVANVSNTSMDSLLVKYVLTNPANQSTETYIRNAPLQGKSTLNATFDLPTSELSGKHFLSIEVNPNKDQPERYAFNNVGTTQFFVTKDQTPPMLDVTFDGVHIMSGDLVSPKPNILISLKDENPFFALEDTTTFELFVRYPSGNLRRFYVDNQTVIFRPADGNNLGTENKAEIEFLPEFFEDGVYQLQVKGKDASDNLAGANQYKVDFEVITKAMISNVLNYPNPFTTSTQFVFTLTGTEIPEAMNIQIMTVSGKIVKTITKEELGDLRIGHNRTDYKWDGTDDFGAPLANGVYLYRVNLKSSTDEIYEKFNNGTDDYFKNGFGKMVILR